MRKNEIRDNRVLKPVARAEDLLVQKTEDEVLVYDLRRDKAICLNETSALVWELCDGTRTPQEIAKEIETELVESVNVDLVWFAIDQLGSEKLLESPAAGEKYSRISRREVVRKIGFGSMIALPIVSSLVAPRASHAQTCVGMAANFPPGQQTAAGTYPGGVCDPADGVGICSGQGANCCTAVAAIMCPTPGAAPFTCNCT